MSAPNDHDSQSGLSPLQIVFLFLASGCAFIGFIVSAV